MIILSIADFHTPAVRREEGGYTQNIELQNAVHYFCRFMSELRDKEPGWTPDYLCICGDIASRAEVREYELAEELIRQLAQTCFLSDDYILMVPGNHDICISHMLEKKDNDLVLKVKEKNEYFQTVDNLLNKGLKEGDVERLSHSFASYSNFRGRFVKESVSYHSFPYVPSPIKYACGYKVFEKNKTVFVELNSSWLDLPKSPVRNAMCFGNSHIQWLYNEIKELKQRGFYIVTMFHHSLRYLDLKEYQTRDLQFPVYDRIIEMSDLCLSGHEHGSKSKEPDMLGNACQYILNGGFYSPDTHNRVMESSASLIKIDTNNEQLTIRRFAKDTDWTWHEGRAPKTYSILSQLRNEIVDQKATSRLSNVFAFEPTDKMRLYHRIILKYFGSNYKLLKAEKAGFFKLLCGDNDVYHIAFPEMNREIAEISLECEPNVQSIVVCICRCDKETDKRNYLDLKHKYKREILKNKMIFFFLSTDF